MKILIVSDTHGQEKNLEEVLEKESPIDALIHLGDLEGGEDFINTHVSCPAYLVSGNNDFFCSLPREREITLGNSKVLLTPGHYYYVSLGVEDLRRQAASRDYQVVMFGHPHKPYFETKDGVTILNPGSLSYPRQEGRRPSYMIMEIDEKGEAHYSQKYL